MDLLARTCSVCGKFALDEDDIEALTQPARINAAFAGRKSGELADARDQLRGVVEALAELVAAQGDIGRWAAVVPSDCGCCARTLTERQALWKVRNVPQRRRPASGESTAEEGSGSYRAPWRVVVCVLTGRDRGHWEASVHVE
jgi:hypothetical protein